MSTMARRTGSPARYTASPAMSWLITRCSPRNMRPSPISGCGRNGPLNNSRTRAGIPCWAAIWKHSPSNVQRVADCRFAQVHRLLEYSVEDRREIPEGGIDDLQHFRGCGLLVFGIGEITSQRVAFGSARRQLRFKLVYGPQCIDQSCF